MARAPRQQRAPREQTIETYPEADRLEPFPHPRHTKRFYGHAAQAAELAAGLKSGRLHHGWLFTGPPGIGKATLAYRFARAALAAQEPENVGLLADDAPTLDVPADAQAAHLVAALSHPDLLVLRRPYDRRAKRHDTALTADEVRRLRDFLGHKQTSGGWKVVLVDSADDLNVNAANALLKSLEEPPRRVLFVLISSMPGRLLTTIRSRCRTLTFQPLGDDDLRQATSQALMAVELALPGDDAWPPIVREAGGSVRNALSLASEEGAQLAAKVDKLFGQIARPDWTALHQMADEFSPIAAADRFDAFMELVHTRLARLIRAAATGAATADDLSEARRLGLADALASWAELWETLVRDKAMQSGLNLDRKAHLLDAVRAMNRLTANR